MHYVKNNYSDKVVFKFIFWASFLSHSSEKMESFQPSGVLYSLSFHYFFFAFITILDIVWS